MVTAKNGNEALTDSWLTLALKALILVHFRSNCLNLAYYLY